MLIIVQYLCLNIWLEGLLLRHKVLTTATRHCRVHCEKILTVVFICGTQPKEREQLRKKLLIDKREEKIKQKIFANTPSSFSIV